jgi:hypothetical protein
MIFWIYYFNFIFHFFHVNSKMRYHLARNKDLSFYNQNIVPLGHLNICAMFDFSSLFFYIYFLSLFFFLFLSISKSIATIIIYLLLIVLLF